MILTDDRRDRLLPLDTLAAIPAAALQRLTALGVTTLAELRDLWAFGDRARLTDYLGEPPTRWFAEPLPLARATRGDSGGAPAPRDPLGPAGLTPIRHPRGLLAAGSPRPAPSPAPLPPTTRRPGRVVADLRPRFPAVRNQGQRGTCVAFAATALFEYHRQPAAERHSEQFLYWACKQRDGLPDTEGTFVETARAVLAAAGLCRHATWPYSDVLIPGNEGHHPPPAAAAPEAARFTHPDGERLAAHDPAALCRALDDRRPVVVGVETFRHWDFPNVQENGEIAMPLPNELPDGGHALVLVGYELREGIPGGGRFMFRNAWGEEWAARGQFGPGYGTLYFDYLRHHGLEAFC